MRIVFVLGNGAERRIVTAKPGDCLLDVAQDHDIPIEGACEGQMACSTCHVILDRADFGRFPSPSEEEEDMLDFAYGVTPTSRLCCQMVLSAEHDGLEVKLPQSTRNMLRV
jgi:ferredoxin-2, mitochondrial